MQPLLVLHEEYDLSASWRADRLRARGRVVCNVPARLLGAATLRWHHRLGADGVDFTLAHPDGTSVSPRGYRGVVNRLHYLPLTLLARIGGADEDYARSELYALFLSWMTALPRPLLNAPTPQGLAGNWRHPSAWTALAQAAGLRVVPWSQDASSDPERGWATPEQPGEITVVVVGDRLVPPAAQAKPSIPAEVEAACVALARNADVGILGIRLVPDPAIAARWRFVGANLLPDLAAGGEALVDAVDAVMAP
jgi:hypothetical protein